MWVPNRGGGKYLRYALNVSTNHYSSSEDFKGLEASRNNSTRGLWSDGMTIWVVDDSYFTNVVSEFVKKTFAYNLKIHTKR